jgi:hypothetical protein
MIMESFPPPLTAMPEGALCSRVGCSSPAEWSGMVFIFLGADHDDVPDARIDPVVHLCHACMLVADVPNVVEPSELRDLAVALAGEDADGSSLCADFQLRFMHARRMTMAPVWGRA